jgi:uncharacterized membrane protein YdcZ (DUF606 family)
MTAALILALAFCVGAVITVQVGTNTRLKEAFGEAMPAVIVSSMLGVATLTAAVVTGQLVCSVVLDHFGALGFTEHALGVGRVAGCVLMIAGFVLIARY